MTILSFDEIIPNIPQEFLEKRQDTYVGRQLKAGNNAARESSFINKATHIWDRHLHDETCYLAKKAFTLERAEVSFEEASKISSNAYLTEKNDLSDLHGLLLEMYSSLDDDVLSALVVLLHEFTEKKQNDSAVYTAKCLELIGVSHIDLVLRIMASHDRVLFSLITDFLSIDIFNQQAPGHQRGPSVYFRGRSHNIEQRLLAALLAKGRRLQKKEDMRTLIAKDIDEKQIRAGGGDVLRMKKHIVIEMPAVAPTAHPVELVRVLDALPTWTHSVFGAIHTLNPVQSKVFPIAFQHDENMLVAAPTGCGKTLVAVLVILRLLDRAMQRDGTDENFRKVRIVYLVPMKALASEIVVNLQRRFGQLKLIVREYTGDTSLSRAELEKCNILVSTPEKWDIITRKSAENAILDDIQLVIIDEVHILSSDRGPVIEAIVSRALMSQDVTGHGPRLVGLSATLPNAKDVANFLRVQAETGLLVFGEGFRPIPLHKTYIGIKEKLTKIEKEAAQRELLGDALRKALNISKQVMIFVHTRNNTLQVAKLARDLLHKHPDSELLHTELLQRTRRFRLQDANDLLNDGLGIHHAGMVHADRALTEDLFKEGIIRVLVSTATLAWGVNLPAHTVIIYGTEMYNPKQGSFVHISHTDVLQIFGRAGRPGFDTSGHGIIITAEQQVQHYVRMLSFAPTIESNMQTDMPNHLNAEIAAGTVNSMADAIQWVEYTYLWHRISTNPFAYGVSPSHLRNDPNLVHFRRDAILKAVKKLQASQMVRFDENTNVLHSTEIGRIASHFYIGCESMAIFLKKMTDARGDPVQLDDDDDLLSIVASSRDFAQLRVRSEEEDELLDLSRKLPIMLQKKNNDGSLSASQKKVMNLLKFHLSRICPSTHSLASEMLYVVECAQRILRGLFELEIHRKHFFAAIRFLHLAKAVDRRMCEVTDHPIRQFAEDIHAYVINRIENRMVRIEDLFEMSAAEIGDITQSKMGGIALKNVLKFFPRVAFEVQSQPITRKVLRVHAKVSPLFKWSDKHHGSVDTWWLFARSTDDDILLHSCVVKFTKETLLKKESVNVEFTVPVASDSVQYDVELHNTSWVGAREHALIHLKGCDILEDAPQVTPVLPLAPLSRNAIPQKFHPALPYLYLNAVQSQCFHTMYHTNHNVFLGAPTGSGKTMCAEFAMLRVLQSESNSGARKKVVYIAPLKALVRERMGDWKCRYQKLLGFGVLEMSGEASPSPAEIAKCSIICTTPEKWDGISRNWTKRSYVRDVDLVIIDETHLLNSERGPTLELVVSRTKIISESRETPVRIIALSTAVANATDIGKWLGVPRKWALFNFDASVRPVTMKCFISGFPGRAYCPRMATMNKPVFHAICEKSPTKPVIIFVSSRRQTRLTALALINLLLAQQQPKRFTRMGANETAQVSRTIEDAYLKYTVSFGVGIHHGGLCLSDRGLVEHLFKSRKLQIMVATSTLAWGVNFPAHMVIVKGTEFFDCKSRGYVDYSITDILQMIGRAGRPQYDTEGRALVLTQEAKKDFYKRFLFGNFPVESFLPRAYIVHINAEIVSGTIRSACDVFDFFTWTFMFRRLMKNPLYYGIQDTSGESIMGFLANLVQVAISDLQYCFCVEKDEDDSLQCTQFGELCSFYYLAHQTMRRLVLDIQPRSSREEMLSTLSNAEEFAELPVRHNEDKYNIELAKLVPIKVDMSRIDTPHTKAHLLFQALFERCEVPVSDYSTDMRSVVENSARLVQAMIDVAACQGYLVAALGAMDIGKAISQRRWWSDRTLLQIPHFSMGMLSAFSRFGINEIKDCIPLTKSTQEKILDVMQAHGDALTEVNIASAMDMLESLPNLSASIESSADEKFSRVSVTVHCAVNKKCQGGQKNRLQFYAVLGDTRVDELIVLKHIHQIETKQHFNFQVEWKESWNADLCMDKDGYPGHTLKFYLISGDYFGLDLCDEVFIRKPT